MESVLSILPRNYKNLMVENAIPLENLTILIGPNASGKSNLIQLLQFLNACTREGQDVRIGTGSGRDHVFQRSR